MYSVDAILRQIYKLKIYAYYVWLIRLSRIRGAVLFEFFFILFLFLINN